MSDCPKDFRVASSCADDFWRSSSKRMRTPCSSSVGRAAAIAGSASCFFLSFGECWRDIQIQNLDIDSDPISSRAKFRNFAPNNPQASKLLWTPNSPNRTAPGGTAHVPGEGNGELGGCTGRPAHLDTIDPLAATTRVNSATRGAVATNACRAHLAWHTQRAC
eukprot:SAG11_NODE_3712_length_2266_cov_16.035072_2_plen_163_part_00